jgi:hypothetical protein
VAVCKTVGIAYVGSNPTPATSRSSGVDQLIRQVDLLTSRLNRLHAEGSGLSSGTRFANGLSLGMTRRGPCLSGFDWPVVSVRIRLVAPDAIPTLPRLRMSSGTRSVWRREVGQVLSPIKRLWENASSEVRPVPPGRRRDRRVIDLQRECDREPERPLPASRPDPCRAQLGLAVTGSLKGPMLPDVSTARTRK